MTPKPITEELAWALDIAADRVSLAKDLLQKLRSVRIGRLQVTWMGQPTRIDPVRLRHPGINAFAVVDLTQEARVTDAGVTIDQVLRINASVRIVAETRFYSHEFYRQAIAKFEDGLR